MAETVRWEALEAEIEGLLAAEGFELVQLERLGARYPVLRIRVDHPQGVTVEDCARLSAQIGTYLDVADPFSGAYRLEVSSPGVDRPLVRDRDFERFKGHRVQITFRGMDGRKRTVCGVLQGLVGAEVRLEAATGPRAIPQGDILSARLQWAWADEEA